MTIDKNLAWWKYPQKPIRASKDMFKRIDPQDYSLEKKFDGHRVIIISGKNVELWTRERNKIEAPKQLLESLRSLHIPEGTVLDGEIWNPTKRGGWKNAVGMECKVTLWDCIRSGTKDIGQKPIEERRAALKAIIPRDLPNVQVVEVFPASLDKFEEIFQEAAQFRAEIEARSGFIHGVVLKRNKSVRRDHATRSTENADWIKIIFAGMSGWAPRV